MKTTLASELANFAAGSSTAAGQCEHTRESGPLHGSQHTKCNNNFMDKVLHDRLQGMDDNAFQTFADRLNKVRSAINR